MRGIQEQEVYYHRVDAWGDPSNCDPLVFEHFGHWGGRRTNFFMNYLSDSEMKMERRRALDQDWKSFSVTLEHCNASAIRHKLEGVPSLWSSD